MSVSRRRFLLGLPLAAGALALPRDRVKSRAIGRGLQFIHRTAANPQYFSEYGDDLLWCFYSISRAAADPELARTARAIAREQARAWRRGHQQLPDNVSLDTLCGVAYGEIPAGLMGFTDERLKEDIRRAAKRFSTLDFLGFDPRIEGVPADIPDACGK